MDDLRLPFVERISTRQWTVVDLALVAVVTGSSAAAIALGHVALTPTGVVWSVLRYVGVGVSCAPLPFRRRAPTIVFGAISLGLAFLCALCGLLAAVLVLTPAAYSVASTATRRVSLRVTVTGVVVVEVGALSSRVVGHGTAVLAALALTSVGWLAGENARARRLYLKAALERAGEREREREQRARRAGAEERLRIARELHDVVAHAMSIIAVRSGVARMVLDVRPDEAREALGIIEMTSRQALQELRLLVGVMRGHDAGGIVDGREPAPGLADLEGLVTRINEAGVSVDIRVEGTPRRLGPGADLSAYRIVQEALTNVVRHAGPARADLTICYLSSAVMIEVSDDGRTRSSASSTSRDATAGHGIIGMRERVAVYGGTLVAEPTPAGFRVLAHIPTVEGGP